MQNESEGSSFVAPLAGIGLALVLLLAMSFSVFAKVSAAEERLLRPEPEAKPKVAVAAQAVVTDQFHPTPWLEVTA